jgi:ribosomal protein S18 acetylase RimI-like enzyme
MNIFLSQPDDLPEWFSLAREVEPLFGPMVDVPEFQSGLLTAINENRALCVRDENDSGTRRMVGGVIIDTKENEILWLAVSQTSRGRGVGRILLMDAITRMDTTRPIRVQTYATHVEAGNSARHLYTDLGFTDVQDGGLNPAGLPTVIMERPVK